MINIDKHAVQAVADLKAGYTLGHADVAILNEMARIALASIEAEPVDISDDMAYAFHHALSDSSLGADDVDEIKTGLRAVFANITAPPAPVSVPFYQVFSFKRWRDVSEEVFEEEKKDGCQVRVLYTAPPTPVSVPDEMDLLTCHLDGVTETYAEGWNTCRAAMLKGEK